MPPKGAEKFGWFEKAKRPKDTGRYRRGIGVSSGLHVQALSMLSLTTLLSV